MIPLFPGMDGLLIIWIGSGKFGNFLPSQKSGCTQNWQNAKRLAYMHICVYLDGE